MSFFYPNQVIDLRFQVDLLTPMKIQLFEENRAEFLEVHIDSRIFTILFRRKKLTMVSNANKVTEIKVA